MAAKAGAHPLDYSLWDEHKEFYFKANQAGRDGDCQYVERLIRDVLEGQCFEAFRAARGLGRERLGLQAINKNGNLAIIENKLDDSGRDVVWCDQGMNYREILGSSRNRDQGQPGKGITSRYTEPFASNDKEMS